MHPPRLFRFTLSRLATLAMASALCMGLAPVSALSAPDTMRTTVDDEQPAMRVQQVSPHGYYVEGLTQLGSPKNQNFISNAGFVITPEGVVVIDTLGSPHLAERLLKAIRGLSQQPVTDVVLTHYHADHVYGLQVFKQLGAHIWAHSEGRAYLQSDTARQRLEASRTDIAPWVDADTHLVEADTWIDGPTSFRRGGMEFRLVHVGPSHTPEDLAVYVPSEKLLYAGDLFFNGRLPFVGKANSSQWIQSLETVLAFDADVVVPGHGPASQSPRKDIGMTRDYLVYLRKTMGQAVADFVPFDQAYQDTDWTMFAHMPMFGPANRMNAYNTYLLMEEEALARTPGAH